MVPDTTFVEPDGASAENAGHPGASPIKWKASS